MKVTRSISLAASGDNGLGLTHPLDCNAWLIDSGEGLILVDAGVNLDNLRIEEEIADMSAEDKLLFLEEMGLHESGLDRLIKKSYALLGLISYLTAGKQEVRAWTITRGT